jgi:hypothetical protein
MNFLVSPNMKLQIPSVGTEPGPKYAQDINNSLTLVDQHDHSPGKGVLITPAGLNINATLTFQNSLATNLAGANFFVQTSTPAIQTVYVSGVDLYYVDGLNNAIRLTQSGAVAGTPGSIANLTPPASASYVLASSTFVFQSGASLAANLDAASILLRNISPNSTYALTLSPPAGLAVNYTVTLPSSPTQTNIVSMNTSGTMSANVNVDGTTLAFSGTTLSVANGGIGTTQIANGAVTAAKLATGALEYNSSQITSSGTFVVPAGVTTLDVLASGGGGGGGGGGTAHTGGGPSGGGGGGAQGSVPVFTRVAVTPGETLTITIGAGGTAGAAGSPGFGNNGGAGGGGGTTIIVNGALDTILSVGGGAGGNPGLSAGGSSSGQASGFEGNGFVSGAGAGGGSASAGSDGVVSFYNIAGFGGSSISAGGGGGGGAGYGNGGSGSAGTGGGGGGSGSSGIYGGGGGGGGGSDTTRTTAYAGGAGGGGIIIFWWLG